MKGKLGRGKSQFGTGKNMNGDGGFFKNLRPHSYFLPSGHTLERITENVGDGYAGI